MDPPPSRPVSIRIGYLGVGDIELVIEGKGGSFQSESDTWGSVTTKQDDAWIRRFQSESDTWGSVTIMFTTRRIRRRFQSESDTWGSVTSVSQDAGSFTGFNPNRIPGGR